MFDIFIYIYIMFNTLDPIAKNSLESFGDTP